MEYRLHMGPWNSVFAVPTALVDRYLKLAGKEQLQVLLWMLRHGGEAFSPEALAQELALDQDAVLDALDYWQPPRPRRCPKPLPRRRDCLPSGAWSGRTPSTWPPAWESRRKSAF